MKPFYRNIVTISIFLTVMLMTVGTVSAIGDGTNTTTAPQGEFAFDDTANTTTVPPGEFAVVATLNEASGNAVTTDQGNDVVVATPNDASSSTETVPIKVGNYNQTGAQTGQISIVKSSPVLNFSV